ncbi:hypothetical protein MVEN_00471900 [Mycena venus]|uniref:Uncharacterized protein n=1 Tax=Mycena venus TaxID=2733690 RepID=A0A8H7D8A4_9AGAR|nr:hypothetical protein MVEN_00471900 [Mycena venus]
MVPAFGVALALHAFLALYSSQQVHAALINITVDDTDVQFWSYAGPWNSITPSTPCFGCKAHPDPEQAYNKTWHDASLASGSFTFQGSAVYIYGIDFPDPGNLTFGMNNPSITTFHYYGGTAYVYNSLFFSATGLDPTVEHTVTWLFEQSSNSSSGQAGLMDYALVTVDQQKPKTKTKAVVGAVVGVLGGLTLLGAAFMFWRHRRTNARTPMLIDSDGPDAYPALPMSTGAMGYTIEPHQTHESVPLAARDIPPSGSQLSGEASPAMRSMPVSTGVTSSTSPNSKAPSVPLVMLWDPNHSDERSAREQEMEARVRNLEELVASPPPTYS